MNKKSIYIIVISIIVVGIIAFWIFYTRNNAIKNEQQFNTSRLATEINNINSNIDQSGSSSNMNNVNNTNTLAVGKNEIVEEPLVSYSTKIKSKASGRLNNIRLTCSALNGTVVKSDATFSFCNTLGPSTAEKGYQKADVIENGKTIQALGGGNCQVSSTLYNAVLDAKLTVIERHEHGKDVTYVPEGKDAAVSYGSMDFRFKNNLPNDIKLYFNSDDSNVEVKLVKLVQK